MKGTSVNSHRIGQAMIALAASRADRFKATHDGATFEAYWRGDDKATVKVFARSGAWHDAKTGEHGGGRAFASLHGMSLREMMGSTQTPAAPPTNGTREVPSIAWVDPVAIWEAVRAPSTGLALARTYLAEVRCFSTTGLACVEGRYGGVEVADCGCLPETTQRQLACGGGHALAVPMITPAGRVANVAFRLPHAPPRTPKCVTLPDLPVGSNDAPLGFGDMHAVGAAALIIVVEGLMDTLAARAILGRTATVIGGHSAGRLPSWVRWLPTAVAQQSEIVVVPHVDLSGGGEASAIELTAGLVACGMRARLFRWSACLDRLGVPEAVLRTSITDIADLLLVAHPSRVLAAVRAGLGVVA